MNDSLVFQREYFPGLEISSFNGERVNVFGKTPITRQVTYHVAKIEIEKVNTFFVTPKPLGLRYVHQRASYYGLHLVINLDQWTYFAGKIIMGGRAISEGNYYGTPSWERTLYINRQNRFSLVRPKYGSSDWWMAFSVPNDLIMDGKVSKFKKSKIDIRSRTAIGLEGIYVYFLFVEGGDLRSNTGFNYPQMADIFMERGCRYAFNCDGGGSSTMVVWDKDKKMFEIVGNPCGEDDDIVPGKHLRPVAQVLGVRMSNG